MPDGTNTASPYLGGQPGHHAIERAWERYGLDLTLADLDTIAADCASGRAPLIRRGPHGDVHLAKYRGVVMILCCRGGVVVTFLPPEGGSRRVQLAVIEDTQPRKGARGGKRYRSRRRKGAKRQGNRQWDEED